MDVNLFITSLILGAIIHYGVQKLFIKFKKFDDFNHRSSHNTLATRTGGIGLFAVVFLVSLYYYFQGIEIFDYSLFIPLSIMFIVGVYDDFYSADFKLKFFLQIIVAKILIDQGFVISNYHGFLGLYEVPNIVAQLSTIFVFLVIVNAINFIDGIDGLAITEVIKTILLVEIFSYKVTNLYFLSLILSGAILPLYYFNFKKKRKVFLGDSGSLLLGTVLAIYTFHVLGSEFEPLLIINKTLFSVLILLYPLFDLLRVFFIRIKNKKSPFHPDQNHLHHLVIFKINPNQKMAVFIILLLELIMISIIFYLQKVSITL
jgi:UDP-N-acetylmuramyl pentapeptide phosphotransferase/UDP-N-acetylglucosamine-1-phosphate transferase